MNPRPWLALLSILAWTPAATADATTDRITARMAKMFPDEPVTDIAPSPVPSLYEVMLGASLFYISADARYVFHGDLIDLERRVNLADERREHARKLAFEGVDVADTVEFAPANPKAMLYVYTDIDCGYCRKLHGEVPQLNAAGIGVRYLAFPRSGLDGESFTKAAAVWCSADRKAAMTAAKSGENVNAPSCDNPVASQYEMGRSMGITGTPAVYTTTGRQLGGYVPATELIRMAREGKL